MLKKRPPMRMRGPTLNEVRLVDRLLHEEVLSFAARGDGNLPEGLAWFASQGRGHKYWSFLDVQPENHPDQGLERSELTPAPPSFPPPKIIRTVDKTQDKADGMRCHVCGKTRHEHPRRRFCIPDGAVKGKGGKKGAGKGKGGK